MNKIIIYPQLGLNFVGYLALSLAKMLDMKNYCCSLNSFIIATISVSLNSFLISVDLLKICSC